MLVCTRGKAGPSGAVCMGLLTVAQRRQSRLVTSVRRRALALLQFAVGSIKDDWLGLMAMPA